MKIGKRTGEKKQRYKVIFNVIEAGFKVIGSTFIGLYDGPKTLYILPPNELATAAAGSLAKQLFQNGDMDLQDALIVVQNGFTEY